MDHWNGAWITWLSGLQNNGVNTRKHIHKDPKYPQGILRTAQWTMVVNHRKKISALETSERCKADPLSLESILNVSWAWRPPGGRPLMHSACSAPPPPHRTASLSWLQTQNANNVQRSRVWACALRYLFKYTYTLSLHKHFLLPHFPQFLLPCFQFEATADNTAISGGRPGMAAQSSEAERGLWNSRLFPGLRRGRQLVELSSKPLGRSETHRDTKAFLLRKC